VGAFYGFEKSVFPRLVNELKDKGEIPKRKPWLSFGSKRGGGIFIRTYPSIIIYLIPIILIK
jgi:hypothetical protein